MGRAEVESSAGTGKEKLSRLETGTFSSSSCVSLIVILEMNLLPDMTALGPFLSYICVIHLLSVLLCAHQLFCSSTWIHISLDDFHSPVGSCLSTIKAGVWK